MVTDPTPTNGWLAVESNPFPGCASVGVVLAPGALPNAFGALDRLHPQPSRPWVVLTSRGPYGSIMKGRDTVSKLLLMLWRETLEVAVERGRGLELHSLMSASR